MPASSYDLLNFRLSDMIRCGRELRAVGERSPSMEAAAQHIASFFHEKLVADDGARSCALVRCFKTHPLGTLPPNLARAAQDALSPERGSDAAAVPCLTLLGSAGDLEAWNSRDGSQGHKAIPLESAEVIERAPMIAQLIRQMGLSVADVVQPTPEFLLDAEQRAFNVFYVPEARGSRFVPAQEFVESYGIRSVLGFGSLLPSGDLFAVILFSRTPIAREVADMFRTLALSTKLVLLPYARGPIFDGEPIPAAGANDAAERQRAEIATLQLLIPALEDVALEQTERLESAATEAQQRAEQVRELNAALERRVEERTSELQATNEELKAFSYSVSHDLRAPLRSIAGFAAALEEDYRPELDATAGDYIGRIRAAVTRMNGLIDSMLELARVAGAELRHSAVDLSALSASVASELAERDPARRVAVSIAPGLHAQGDPYLVRALLENLLGNAWKFTALQPAATIRLGWSAEHLAFFVEDNGVGFSMDHARRLFRPFSRLHTASEFQGTGVGLATVARIVRRHGGTLWATGAIDQGATFYFRLP